MRFLPVTAALVHVCILLMCLEGRAQTIKDDVKQFVEESLEDEQEDAREEAEREEEREEGREEDSEEKPKSKPQEKRPGKKKHVAAPKREDYEHPVGNHLPLRVMHENFRLDLKVGAGYRGWAPQQYTNVSVEPANYFTWSVGASALFFKTVNLSKARYESNSAASPRTSYVESAARYGSWALKAAWFLAELGIPVLDRLEPSVRYEARSFMTTARSEPGTTVCVVPFNQDTDVEGCPTRSRDLTITSSLETAAVGLKIHPGKGSFAVMNDEPMKAPSFFVGAGYLSYLKPYQVTIGEHTLDEYLFTGRFYGGGLALGMEVGGGVNKPYIDVWAQLGLGKVRLTGDLTLNELAPEDWLIGYVQGNAMVSFRWAPFDWAPTLLIVPSGTVSGASFFFFETNANEDRQVATPNINWDVLYTVRLSLILTL